MVDGDASPTLLSTYQGGEVILDKRQDGIGHLLQLTAQVVLLVDSG